MYSLRLLAVGLLTCEGYSWLASSFRSCSLTVAGVGLIGAARSFDHIERSSGSGSNCNVAFSDEGGVLQLCHVGSTPEMATGISALALSVPLGIAGTVLTLRY